MKESKLERASLIMRNLKLCQRIREFELSVFTEETVAHELKEPNGIETVMAHQNASDWLLHSSAQQTHV